MYHIGIYNELTGRTFVVGKSELSMLAFDMTWHIERLSSVLHRYKLARVMFPFLFSFHKIWLYLFRQIARVSCDSFGYEWSFVDQITAVLSKS